MDDRTNTGEAWQIPWDFKHWGDPQDYEGYDPDANYVDTLNTELLDTVRNGLLDAQDRGLIQNVQSHHDKTGEQLASGTQMDHHDKALAEQAEREARILEEDIRNVINLASEIEDVAPEEAESLDRLRQSLDGDRR